MRLHPRGEWDLHSCVDIGNTRHKHPTAVALNTAIDPVLAYVERLAQIVTCHPSPLQTLETIERAKRQRDDATFHRDGRA